MKLVRSGCPARQYLHECRKSACLPCDRNSHSVCSEILRVRCSVSKSCSGQCPDHHITPLLCCICLVNNKCLITLTRCNNSDNSEASRKSAAVVGIKRDELLLVIRIHAEDISHFRNANEYIFICHNVSIFMS